MSVTAERREHGRQHNPAPQRVCSLLPSATEILGALGLADRLVGVSAECDRPTDIRGLPVVSASRVDTSTLTSREIDEAVRASLADGRSLYGVEQELIDRLDPDLVITQDLCTVCAVSGQELGSLCSIDAETVALDAHTIADIESCVRWVAERFAVPERGDEVVATMTGRIRGVGDLVADRSPTRVFVCEWVDPPFAGGHWVPEMVRLAGGAAVLGRPGEPSFPTSWPDVRAAEPDLVVSAPCGFDAERAAEETRARMPPVDCRVVAVDANAHFSRPSPHIAEGVAQLGHLLHPDVVPDPGLPMYELTS